MQKANISERQIEHYEALKAQLQKKIKAQDGLKLGGEALLNFRAYCFALLFINGELDETK